MSLKSFFQNLDINYTKLSDSQLERILIRLFQEEGVLFNVHIRKCDSEIINYDQNEINSDMDNEFDSKEEPEHDDYYSNSQYNQDSTSMRRNVKCNSNQIIIEQGLSQEQDLVILIDDIIYTIPLDNSISIELSNNTEYSFFIDNYVEKQWNALGFNKEIPLNILYKILRNHQDNLKKEIDELKKIKEEKTKRKTLVTNKFKLKYNTEIECPVCGKIIKKKAIRCKYCKTMLNTPEYQEEIRKTTFSKPEFKSCPNCGAMISLTATRCKFCNEMIFGYNLRKQDTEKLENQSNPNTICMSDEDIPFKKIQQAKKLLDMGAITTKEFQEIKSRYLDKL